MKPILLLMCWVLAACGPIPGGSLSGTVVAVPTDWHTALGGEHALCEIESRPSDPHSIQLECFLYEGALYVQSHRYALASWWPAESWAAIWIAKPDLRVRIGGSIYALHATHVSAAAVRNPVLAFRGYDPIPAGIVLFRLEAPPSSA